MTQNLIWMKSLSWESAEWQSNLVFVLLLTAPFVVWNWSETNRNGFWFTVGRSWVVWALPEISDLSDSPSSNAAVCISRNWCKLIFRAAWLMGCQEWIQFSLSHYNRRTRRFSLPQNQSTIVKSLSFSRGWIITKTFWKIWGKRWKFISKIWLISGAVFKHFVTLEHFQHSVWASGWYWKVFRV